jgi:prevent-host-death family protein
MQVGIRELKARLSELVERAAGGETIRITDRGRLKAELTAPSTTSRIEQGIAEGWITPRRRHDGFDRPRRRFRTRVTVEQMLDEDRGVE